MRNLISIFSIVSRRLYHSLGLSISALIGIICVLTLVICIPIFAYAVSGALLQDQLNEQASKSGHPPFAIRMYYLYDRKAVLDLANLKSLSDYLPNLTSDLVGIRPSQVVTEITSMPVDLLPTLNPDLPEWSKVPELKQRLKFAVIDGLEDHAELVDGVWPGTNPDGPIQVAIHSNLADKSFFNVGNRYTLTNGVEIEISGIWQEIDPEDPFFYDEPQFHFGDLMWIPAETFETRVSKMLAQPIRYASWYILVGEDQIQFQRAGQYTKGMLRLDNDLRNLALPVKMDYSPLESLVAYQNRVKSLTTLLYAVGAPLAILALLFISLTSIIVVQEYSQEIAMLRSRGTSRVEILLMNILETLTLLIIAIPISIGLGWISANLMGQTESFLRFTQRPLLPFSYQGINFLALILAGVLIILARLMPAWYISQRTIIKLKQEQSRSETKPVWQRFYLDFILLVISGYTYLSLSGWRAAVGMLNQIGCRFTSGTTQSSTAPG